MVRNKKGQGMYELRAKDELGMDSLNVNETGAAAVLCCLTPLLAGLLLCMVVSANQAEICL